MPLYGHEMDDTVSPREAGLGIFVKMDKEDFIGKDAIEAMGKPPKRRKIGLKVTGRGIIREHQDVFQDGKKIGVTTSGTHCPYLDHEFVMSLEHLKNKTGVSALDVAKGLLDYGIHPPTMYFPLIVEEALMIEPTETEPKETLDEAIEALRALYQQAQDDPEALHNAPHNTVIGRPDEVGAARNTILRYIWE